MQTATKLFQKIPIGKMSTTEGHVLNISHPPEDVVDKAAVVSLDGLVYKHRVCLEQGMTGMHSEIVEGLIATVVMLDDACIGRIGGKPGRLALETDRREESIAVP